MFSLFLFPRQHPPHNRLHQLLAVRLGAHESGFELIAEGKKFFFISYSIIQAQSSDLLFSKTLNPVDPVKKIMMYSLSLV